MATYDQQFFAQPKTLEEVEQLVKLLYQSGNQPAQLVELQHKLHQLQISNDGWSIANGLLGSSDPNVRFFGAVTFSIKLNLIHGNLDEDSQREIEQSILHWLYTHTVNGDKRTVTKLTTSLALFHLKILQSLPNSITKLVLLGVGLDPQTLDADVQTSGKEKLAQLDPAMYQTILTYINAIAEESTKMLSTMTSKHFSKLKNEYTKALPDALFIIHFALTEYGRSSGDQSYYSDTSNSAMAALSSTTQFTSHNSNVPEEISNNLSSCLTAGIDWCLGSLSENAIEQLVEALGNSSRSLNDDQYQAISGLLRGNWGRENLESLRDGSESGDDNQFVSLALAYGEAQLEHLSEMHGSLMAREFFGIMQEFLKMPGLPELEDQTIPRVLEFWDAYVELVEDAISDGIHESSSPWMKNAIEQTTLMAISIRQKIELPSWAVWDSLSSEERKMIRDFRTDVKDLLQSSCRIVKLPLVNAMTQAVWQATPLNEWHQAESAMFCLLAFEASTYVENDPCLTALFASDFYRLVLGDEDPSQITRRTAIDFIGQSTMVFKRHAELLPTALNFLFPSLQHEKTSDQASKSIYLLCSTSRQELAAEIPTFLAQCELFISSPNASEFAVERISGAIGVLLQALPISQTISGVHTLLKYVTSGLASAKDHLNQGRAENGRMIANKAMRCLSSIAKSLQAPMDDVVDVDEDRPSAADQVGDVIKHQLETLQSRIYEILATALQILGDDGDIIDDISNVFKAGFTEPAHSIFHFAPNIVVQFFQIITIQTPRIEAVLSMGCAFLRSLPSRLSEAQSSSVSQIGQLLATLMANLNDPRTDPETAQSLIEMLSRFMPDYLDILLQLQPVAQVEIVIGFTIKAIEVPEPLPKRSALSYWNNFLTLTPSTNAEATKVLQDQVLVHYGPALSAAMIRQISGTASRVDLEYFVSPLKKLLKRHVQAKTWLQDALTQIPAPADKGKALITALALPTTIGQTKQLLTSWWNDCRGISSDYQPIS